MKVTLLGTGDAIGTPKIGCKCPACMDALRGGRSRRMRFSILLESDEEDGRVLVDSSPDLRWQLLKKDIASVDGVIWTHAHYDHYAGFGDFHRVQSHVDVYALKNTMDYILNYLYSCFLTFLRKRCSTIIYYCWHYVSFIKLLILHLTKKYALGSFQM